MKTPTFIIAIALLLFSTEFLLSQGMLREIPLKQQIKNSSLVVEGKVIGKKSVWNADHNNIYTIHTIQVYKVFKGASVSTIDIITPGGKVNDVEQIVIPSLKLDENDTGVFTLYHDSIMENTLSKSSVKKFSVYSSLQGFYKYDVAQDVVSNPFSRKQTLSKSFYDEISSLTKSNYIEIAEFDIKKIQSKSLQNKGLLLPPGSITFNPTTIAAGSKEVLTINGSGFGNVKGKVGFRDADFGGEDDSVAPAVPVYIDALDNQVLTWSDSQITVEVPSNAGTGDIRITNNDSSQGVSTGTLTVSYALVNTSDGLGTQHFSRNGNGNLTWQMNTNFDANTQAKESFLRAFESWRCETGINWLIGANTSISSSGIDNTSVITFDNASNPLPDGVLGRCTYVISSCNPRTVRDFVGELDIVFDDDLNDPSTPATESWYFGSNPNGIAFEQWDFQSVALHELGHGHQLGHVINTNNVMHYRISNFEIQRTLSTNDINAAGIIQNFSTTTAFCGTDSMANYAGSCGLSVNEEELNGSISLYPNPATSTFYIKNGSFINLKKAVIYDISGRLISNVDISNTSRIKTIDVTGVSKGVYFVNIHSDNAMITRKMILD